MNKQRIVRLLLCLMLFVMTFTAAFFAAGCANHADFIGNKLHGGASSSVNGGTNPDDTSNNNSGDISDSGSPSESGPDGEENANPPPPDNTDNQNTPEHPDVSDGNGETGGGGTDGTDGKNDEETPTPAPEPTEENVVIFVAENFKFIQPYSIGDTAVNAPAVPEKAGYIGVWQKYDLSAGGTVTVNAVYTLKEYAINFVAESEVFVRTYTVMDNGVEVPEIPPKKGYTAEWEDFALTYGDKITVNAIYTAINYKITFVAEGFRAERTYTINDCFVDEPEVPHKTGYTGVWRYGELTYGEDMTAVAEYTPIPSTDVKCFKWKLTADKCGYCITGYIGEYAEVIIPSVYKGLPVTEIGLSAFCCDEPAQITGVIISENVKIIGNYAFADCQKLVSAEFPQNLESIGAGAFCNTGLAKADLPANLKTIGQQAFYGTQLREIVIPDGVTEMGHSAFSNCLFLKSAIIGNGLEELSYGTFANCTALEAVVIGKNVNFIDFKTFSNCTLLKSAEFTDREYWYESNQSDMQNLYAVDPVRLADTEWAARILVNGACNMLFKKDC